MQLVFVLINSEINKHLPESRRKLHYLLKASEYEFLGDQDRFVDCSDFKRFLRHSQIFEQLFVLINTKEVFWNMQALKYR